VEDDLDSLFEAMTKEMAVGRISETLYIGRPDLLSLGDELDHLDLDEALADAAPAATDIVILGGFYSAAALVDLCRRVPRSRREACRVRIAVGLPSTSRIPETWSDMRAVRNALVKAGFRAPIVAVVDCAPVHFHTKLFRFLHTTRPIWFVGSANPGSARHELMVRLAGRHSGLSDYVEAVFAKATSVDRKPPRRRVSTLRDFFLSGVLCHKPPVQPLFTFDAFVFDAEQRLRLGRALAGSAGVAHASPRTEGFGFNLRSALGSPDADPIDADDPPTAQRRYRPSSIDTSLGLWVPTTYADELVAAIAREEDRRERRLARVACALAGVDGEASVRSAFRVYAGSMETFLERHGISARPVTDRDAAFDRFLTSRRRLLNDPEARRRLARSLIRTPMPDIWEDGRAAGAFEESAFEDLAFRAESPAGRKGRAVRSVVDAVDRTSWSTPADLGRAFALRLAEGWTGEDWQV
jgi:hypothetical protein